LLKLSAALGSSTAGCKQGNRLLSC
jgi:hypothetical protein